MMRKSWIIILSVVVVIVLGVGGFFIWKNMTDPGEIVNPDSGDDVQEEIGLAEKAIVKTVKIQESATSANRLIDVQYPSIQSFKNKDFQNYVNNAITDVILAYKDEIMVMIDEETPDTALYVYRTTYEKFANDNYLSLVITNDYNTGGIRSSKWKDIYNIDVSTERIFYLADIFPANVDYEKEILAEIARQAESNNFTLMNGEGLKDLNDKQKFYIDNGKLIIYFDESEIAPATYGVLHFEMPFVLGEDGLFRS